MADDYREEEIIVPIRCPNCGGLNPPENKVCQLCGYKLTGAAPASPPGLAAQPSTGPFDTPVAPSVAPPPALPTGETSTPSFVQSDSSLRTQPTPTPPASAGRAGSALSARLGGSGGGQSPADWLGDLRRTMGGEAPTVDNEPLPAPTQSSFAAPATSSRPTPPAEQSSFAPPPAPPRSAPRQDEQVGFVLPTNPTVSPYRREEQGNTANEPVDWMASLRASNSFTQPGAEIQPEDSEEEPESGASAVPDWLRHLRAESHRAPIELTPEEEEPGDVPPWLSEEVGQDTGPMQRVALPEVEPPASLPPWLRDGTDMLNPARVSEAETSREQDAEPAVNIPAWLQQPPQQEAAPAPTPDTDFGDWFSNRATATPPPAPADTQAAKSSSGGGGFLDDSDAPAWLREVASAPPPPMPRAMSDAEAVVPEAQAVPQFQSPMGEADASAAPPAWLQPDASEAETEAAQATPAATAAEGETLPTVAPTEMQAPPQTVAAAETEATPRRTTTGGLVNPDELPPWLRVVEGEGGAASSANGASQTAPTATPADSGASRFFPAGSGAAGDSTVPAWLRGIGGEAEDVTPAAAEALTAPVADPGQRIQRVMAVRPPRPGAAEALAALVAAPSAATRTSQLEVKDERSYTANLMSWLISERGIYLLVAIIMVAVVIADQRANFQPLGQLAAPPANAKVDSFYKTVNLLPANAPVLIAYDWDANRQAEMLPLAEALTCHLSAVNARFATVSLVPTGPAFAQQVAAATVDRDAPCASRRYNYGSDYVNLGYSAGGDFAMRSMVGSIATVFNKDYVNGNDLFSASSTPALKGVSSLSDFKLIIVLEGDESTARSWVEQVASQPGVPPMLLGTSAALDPSLQPYLANAAPTRFQGKVAGLADVARYQYDLTAKGLTLVQKNLASSLNALSFGHLLVALLIIIGNIVFLTRLVNSRK